MTRVQEARAGSLTREFIEAAKREGLDPERFTARIADGTIVLVRNSGRNILPLVIGAPARIKINANIGTSSSRSDVSEELEKMETAVRCGADAVMDLSTAGDVASIRGKLLAKCPVALGTVPLYEMALRARESGRSVLEISPEEMFSVIEDHCSQGVDFLTLHCGVTSKTVERFREVKRLAGATSRGGTIIMEWIHCNGRENPLYENYDRVLELCARYDVAVSLGDGFRPGALADATDRVQIEEMIILGELVERAREKGVGVFVEGPGHIPLHEVTTNIRIQKPICRNAPFYVLGPLVTDVTPGYDHISGAIGGAVAGMAGADFLCYVTPAEHLRLPSVEDVREGVIASRIAAHAADIARGYPGAIEWDHAISKAKVDLDWERMLSLCIDPEKARAYRQSLPPGDNDRLCSMCGEFCAIKRSRSVL